MFIQIVAVVPEARGRGIGLALLTAAADREPRRNIALATQDDNFAVRSLNAKFEKSIDASIGRVRLDTYRDSDLGIQRGKDYRPWVIQRDKSGRPE
ncbi:GNAT family N-acetyltransferase [Glutamicibacter ardleyensis]|uniref:GNAT family N-acetyltransferase n=1 Tax=Glutamicibacter ardleyensis TaxID=225894 RepID=UPI003FD09D75